MSCKPTILGTVQVESPGLSQRSLTVWVDEDGHALRCPRRDQRRQVFRSHLDTDVHSSTLEVDEPCVEFNQLSDMDRLMEVNSARVDSPGGGRRPARRA